jgi:hypothetical protein
MAQTKYQTRLPNDDAERVEKYVESRNISQAEGIRRLIRAGLDVEAPEDTDESTVTRTHGMIDGNKLVFAIITLDLLMTYALLSGGL